VFGVRGHATVTDTDIKPGDKFIAAKKEYEVLSLIHTTGEIQAIARATA
jgi:molybdenum-dependent DNA-binding transcriptional regulator ModE